MKNLKKYEEYYSDIYRVDTLKLKYNIDDYVLLDVDKIIKNIKKDSKLDELNDFPSDKAKIIAIVNNESYPYKIIFDVTDEHTSVGEEEIIRLLTQEEIENFEAKKEANKYNL